MSPTPSPTLTERQCDLITRAHCDTGGLIEPLLNLKGGAKLKMIGSLAQRGLIQEIDGQWRLTPAAVAFIPGESPVPMPPAPAAIAADPELDAAVTAAEAAWRTVKASTAERLAGIDAKAQPHPRQGSKQALVIEMLKRPEGATIAQISEATGWQKHSIRGNFSGALKKQLGLTITSDKPPHGERVYRVKAAT